jgi:hypothetical protein
MADIDIPVRCFKCDKDLELDLHGGVLRVQPHMCPKQIEQMEDNDEEVPLYSPTVCVEGSSIIISPARLP